LNWSHLGQKIIQWPLPGKEINSSVPSERKKLICLAEDLITSQGGLFTVVGSIFDGNRLADGQSFLSNTHTGQYLSPSEHNTSSPRKRNAQNDVKLQKI